MQKALGEFGVEMINKLTNKIYREREFPMAMHRSVFKVLTKYKTILNLEAKV